MPVADDVRRRDLPGLRPSPPGLARAGRRAGATVARAVPGRLPAGDPGLARRDPGPVDDGARRRVVAAHLVAWAVLVAVIAALYFAVRQIDDRDLVLILASLGLWAGGLAVAASMFGFMAFLLLAPIGALAAVAALLGVGALVLDRRAGWPARTLALLACAASPC